MVLEFLLPLYFAQSGLRTQLWSLDTWALWGTCLALFLIACVAKFVPVRSRMRNKMNIVNTNGLTNFFESDPNLIPCCTLA